jgi:low temperature requirement protein LtrA
LRIVELEVQSPRLFLTSQHISSLLLSSLENVLAHVAVVFFVTFFYRLNLDNYSNRFASDDVFNRILYFAYAWGVSLMTMNIQTTSEYEDACPHMGLNTRGFLVGYLGSRISILIIAGVIMYYNKKSRPQFAYDFILSSIITIIGFFNFSTHINRTDYYKIIIPIEILASVVVFGRYLRPILLGSLGIKAENNQYYIFPLNVLVMQRRLCIFIMMVLGEGIIQLLLPTLNQDHLIRCYSYVFAGLVLLFSFAMLYCDAALREHVHEHAMRRSALRGALFIYIHPLCGFFMFVLGVALKLSYHDVIENHQIHHDVDSLTGVCCGAIVMCILTLRSTHKGILNGGATRPFHKRVRRAFNYFSRSIFVLAHWLVAYRTFYDQSTEVYARDRYLYFHAFLTASSVIIEVCLSHFLSEDDDGTKKKSRHHHHDPAGPHNLTPYQEDDDRVSDVLPPKEGDPESKPGDIQLRALTDNTSPSSSSATSPQDETAESYSSSSIDDSDSMCNPMQGLE